MRSAAAVLALLRPRRRRRSPSADRLPAARGRRRRLHDRRAPRRRAEDARRPRAHHVAQPVGRRGGGALAPPLPERLPQHARARSSASRAGSSGATAWPEDGWGYDRRHALRLADGTDLRPALRFEHPDDDNADDQTVARVPLPQPVPPGGERHARHRRSTAQLPRRSSRAPATSATSSSSGSGSRSSASTSRPACAGRRAGRLELPPVPRQLASSTRTSGHYEVAITVPSRFVVGATGRARRAGATNPDGTTTHTLRAGRRARLRLDGGPALRRDRAQFSADARRDARRSTREAAKLLGRSLDEVRLNDVEITLLLQPGHRPQARPPPRRGQARAQVVRALVRRYPYPTLTVVDPAPGRGRRGGHGVPDVHHRAGRSFLPTTGRSIACCDAGARHVHEFGHQYWYGLVGNNEFEEAWLDEGFNSLLDRQGRWSWATAPTARSRPAGRLRLATLEIGPAANRRDRAFDRDPHDRLELLARASTASTPTSAPS